MSNSFFYAYFFMKKLFRYGYAGLFVGTLFYFLHFPGSTILLLLSASFQLLLSFSFLFIHKYLSRSFLYLCLAFLSLHFVNSLLFWDFGNGLLLLAVLLFIAYILFSIREKQIITRYPFVWLVLILMGNLGLALIPKSSLYYVCRLHPEVNIGVDVNQMYHPWRIYGSLLYKEGKYQEALENTIKAQLILEQQREAGKLMLSESDYDFTQNELKVQEAEIREKLLFNGSEE